MQKSALFPLYLGIIFSVFLTTDLFIQNSTKSTFEYFFAHLIWGDLDSHRDLDFIITTQQRPGQDPALDDIRNQPFQTIFVHRNCTKDTASVIKKIQAALNGLLSEKQFNKILVKGRYRAFPRLFNGVFDGYLELTAIDIFDENGISEYFIIEGIRGGIRVKE